MKRYIVLNKAVLDKVDFCPNCGEELEQIRSDLIRCETCGFRIELANQHTMEKMLIESGAMIAVGIAFILGLEVAKWLLRT